MHDLEFELDTSPSAEKLAAISGGLTEHSTAFTERAGFQPIALFARDAEGRIVAGISGLVNWNWLHVALFWVSRELRGTGLGSRMLLAFEQAGRERGCRHAHLDTFSYQARPFYERHGYELFAELPDYPSGHSRYFLRKRLDP